jgi:hypothetical protein
LTIPYDTITLKFQRETTEEVLMGQAIEYQKLMTEIVYINLPGPTESTPGMSGGELLHGFLAGIYNTPNAEIKNFVETLCLRWNVRYTKGYRDNRG